MIYTAPISVWDVGGPGAVRAEKACLGGDGAPPSSEIGACTDNACSAAQTVLCRA
jgi:hypothetical protein